MDGRREGCFGIVEDGMGPEGDCVDIIPLTNGGAQNYCAIPIHRAFISKFRFRHAHQEIASLVLIGVVEGDDHLSVVYRQATCIDLGERIPVLQFRNLALPQPDVFMEA